MRWHLVAGDEAVKGTRRRLSTPTPSGPTSYRGIDLAFLVQRALCLPLWAGTFACCPPEICFSFVDKGALCRSTGRTASVGGRLRLSILVGLGADAADLALVILHELAHANAGAGHHRRWRQALRAAAIQMFGVSVAERIPDIRGLSFREVEDSVAAGIRAALGCVTEPAFLKWRPTPAVAPLPVPGALCRRWQRALSTGRAGPRGQRRGSL